MRILFMGTPEFAAGALEAILAAGHEVVCAVTQPDKPKGRGKTMQCPPVKECALRHGIPVFQPEKIKEPKAAAELEKYKADLFVVAAFGQILSSEILHMPKYGCINIHASLLPKYRGAAPIQRAILDGEKESGVTIMQMNEGLDTGDMLTRVVVPITEKETGDSLHDKLMEAGAKLVVETIPLIERGELVPQKQEDEKSCYAKMLHKSMGRLDWTQDAQVLERMVRGLNSWPGAYTSFRGKNLKIWEAECSQREEENQTDKMNPEQKSLDQKNPGEVIHTAKDSFTVQTGNGSLTIRTVQIEGKKRMAVKDFLLGYPVTAGELLGDVKER